MKLFNKLNDYLREYPTLRKNIIKTIRYGQYWVFLIKKFLVGEPDGFIAKGRRLTPEGENCYFGYYDKTPYSLDGRIIYHSINSMNAPIVGEKARIYIQDTRSGERVCMGETLAWNLQQGSMLRWIDESHISWNDYRDGDYCNIIKDIRSQNEKKVDFPLYDISGTYGLSLDFERLNIDAEGYGYIQKQKKNFNDSAKIYLVDLIKNSSSVVIDSELLNIKYPVKHSNVDFFYFNHLNFNPDGTRFLFIQRYVHEHKRYSRLFSSDLTGSVIHLLADEDMVSHFTWIDNDNIMVFCRHNNINAYYSFKDAEDHDFNFIDDPKLFVDGHPTILKENSNIFVSDTYPDLSRRRHLFIYDKSNSSYKLLASLKAPIKYDGPSRCDFHPRLNHDDTKICIDSIHENYRGIYEIDV